MIPIMEMFGPTIQGEGARSGVISYFLRVGGCNFTCKGFGVAYTDPDGNEKFGCDSYYAVDQKFKKSWDFLNYKEIVNKMNIILNKGAHGIFKPDIIITGGEPLMYWNNEDFQNVLIYYISRGYKITIETNGSIDIDFTKDYQKEIMFSMSVKLKNSGEAEHRRINIKNLTNILENSKYSYFKFVIGNDMNDVEKEIIDILDSIPYYTDVFVMPMGETTDGIEKHALKTAELAIKNNWKYSDRLHIRLWNDKPGV